MREPRMIRAWCAALSVLAAGACVVEKPRKPRAEAPAIPLPPGPIASPALDAETVQTRVAARVRPAGTVPYDGVTIPLPSPDGRFIATQSAPAPDWPAILAEDGARQGKSRLSVYDVSGERAQRVSWPVGAITDAILGRSAADDGFLVESIRQDGERWIGRVAWLSGEVQWLARGGVCAHGVLGPDGELAFTRRDIGSGVAALVLRAPDGRESTLNPAPGESYAFPLWGQDSEFVYAMILSPDGLELAAFTIEAGVLGAERGRARLSSKASVSAAYQLVAGSPGALPRRTGDDPRDPRPILFHPSFSRMAAFQCRDGSFELLPMRSVAASHAPGGFIASNPDGLVFMPASRTGEARATAKLLDGSHLPRPIDGGEFGWMLFSTARQTAVGDRLSVVFMGLDATAPAH